jgi:hypothetical protein
MKYYPFKKSELKYLPINYRFFERIEMDKRSAVIMKTVSTDNVFMTKEKLVDNFYKPISRCL